MTEKKVLVEYFDNLAWQVYTLSRFWLWLDIRRLCLVEPRSSTMKKIYLVRNIRNTKWQGQRRVVSDDGYNNKNKGKI